MSAELSGNLHQGVCATTMQASGGDVMMSWRRAAVLVVGICGPLSGCAFYRPYEVVRVWGDWNTERQLNFQVENFNHLPLKPVRVRLAKWAYNPGAAGTPVPPRSGSPATTIVPADALPPPPPVPPMEDPTGMGIPQERPTPSPPTPNPPPPVGSAGQDSLDLARPPRLPASKAPRGAEVLPNRPGKIPYEDPEDDDGDLGPTAQRNSPEIVTSVYQSAAPKLVPRPEPRPSSSAAWLFSH
ncbi:MAG TPA: hypothetical protein VL132_12410 [Planctomycetaceae bacterium]|nr:hypothetical protein [Planctomycetaceae bacterium]